jgi:hypothetical protein
MADPLLAQSQPTAAATGLMLMPPTSHLEVTLPHPHPQPLEAGVESPRQPSTRMLMANQVLEDHPESSLPEALATERGEMASIPQVLPTPALSASSSALPMIRPNNTRASTSRSMMTSLSKPQDKVSRSPSRDSRTLLSTTIC